MKRSILFLLLIPQLSQAASLSLDSDSSYWTTSTLIAKDSTVQQAPPKNPDLVPPENMKMQQIATLTSDKDQNIFYLNLMIDPEGKVAGMYNKADPRNRDDTPNKKTVFFLHEIESSKGVVLLVKEKRAILILQGMLDRATQAGKFKLAYLTNGITMKYDNCDFLLQKKAPETAWEAINAYTHNMIDRIFVSTMMIGIKNVEGVCTGKR